jgi:proteasome lid subunit RPN8/RPN11
LLAQPPEDDDLALELDAATAPAPGVCPRPVPGETPLGQVGDGPAGEPEVYLRVRAVEAILAQAGGAGSSESGGVLAGTLCRDEHGAYLLIEAAIPATDARQGRVSLTFTQESWAGMHAALERDHPDLAIVGWYHTHPGLGVFLSGQDLFIQRSFFAAPHQVALVVDPTAGTWGAFRWHGDCRESGEHSPPGEPRVPAPSSGQDPRADACSARSLVAAGRLFIYGEDPAEGAGLLDILDSVSL